MRATMARTVPGTSSAGRARRVPWLRHIIHVAVVARLQPRQQARFRVAQIDIGDADRIEAERRAPGTHGLRQGGQISGAPVARFQWGRVLRHRSFLNCTQCPCSKNASSDAAGRGRHRPVRCRAGRCGAGHAAAARCMCSSRATWARARPRSRARCCGRWATPARSAAPPTRCASPTRWPGPMARPHRLPLRPVPLCRPGGVDRRRIPRLLRRAGVQSRRMAGKGGPAARGTGPPCVAPIGHPRAGIAAAGADPEGADPRMATLRAYTPTGLTLLNAC